MNKKYVELEAVLKAIHTSTAPALEVKAMPAADVVKVRHGQWIFQTYEYMPWCTKAICSSCKQTIANNADLSQDWGKRLFLKDNLFCAKCGAKMDEGQEPPKEG